MADNEKQIPLGGDGQEPPKNVVPINIEEEMRRSYLDYSMSVIIGRALPDVRDGLKPVHRRILYAMFREGLLSNKKFTKCAGVVGEVLKKYHPHGDGAVYDALVRMAQEFNMRYPLVDGQGNFGSVDGDPPAAYRYTEARLTRIAEELLADIDEETVDMTPNFDETTEEPTVMPTRVPTLLLNGSDGIAVGMATKIPPHNLTEIVDAAIELVQNPQTTLDDMLKHVKGPDFPTGGIIYGRSGLRQAYQTGRGTFTIRAKAAIENKGKEQAIIVTEIPYQVNKARLIERIAELVQEKKIEGISDIRDESDREGMRIVMELKRGEQAEIILNQLYKNTALQSSFGMIMLAVVNGQPRELGLREALRLFIEHRIEVVRRRTVFRLNKAREREHLLEGYKIALDNLDAVIKLIRASAAPKEAREGLVSRFRLTEKQAQAILDLQLQRLTGMERQKILDELAEVRTRIAELESILASDKKLRGVIVDELKEIRREYGGEKDKRRTQVIEGNTEEISLEDLIQEETVAVTVTHSGYLKRTAISTYRHQRRGGSGRIGAGTKGDDFVEHFFVATTHTYILVFTSQGRVYWLKVYEIPDAAANAKGKAIYTLVNLQEGETVKALLPVKDLESADEFIVMCTRDGIIKKTAVKEFSNPMSRGIIAMGVDKGDELVSAKLSDGKSQILLASHDGQGIRFRESDVRAMGRPATGVIGMRLDKGDFIVGMEIAQDEKQLVLTVTESGYGKRTPLGAYRLQSRGGSGVINVKTTERNGKVVGVMAVAEDTEIMLISQQGKIIRVGANEIREAGRATQGVRLLRLDEGDRVAAASVIPNEEVNGNGEQPALIQ
jgi:DNA gyrase subunit A